MNKLFFMIGILTGGIVINSITNFEPAN